MSKQIVIVVSIELKIYDIEIVEFIVELILDLLLNDSFVIEFRIRLIISKENNEFWIDLNDVFRHNNKFYVSKRIKVDVFKQCHVDSLIDHFEIKKTLNLIQRKYYWLNRDQNLDDFMNMREYVKNYCDSCVICRRNKTFKHISYEMLSSLSMSKIQIIWYHYKLRDKFAQKFWLNWNLVRLDINDNRSSYEDDALHFCHQKNHRKAIDWCHY